MYRIAISPCTSLSRHFQLTADKAKWQIDANVTDKPANEDPYCQQDQQIHQTDEHETPPFLKRIVTRLREINQAPLSYATRPAFFRVIYAPRFFIVLRPLVETLTVIFLPSSGMKMVFFCKLTWRRRLPVGLNLVARVRLEYPPPTWDFLPVISQTRAIYSYGPSPARK